MSAPADPRFCSNCGARLDGPWCSQCGQKVLTDRERSFGHLLGQFAHELFHFDGKLPRTLAALLFQPGRPSEAYLRGQRVKFLSPIGLFLLVNLVYFIAPPLTDFNVTLHDQYQVQPYSGLIQPMIDQRLAEREMEFDAYADQYNQVSLTLARSLIILHLPLLALALFFLFPRRETYYSEHFIVATHLFTVLLLVVLIWLPATFLVLWIGHTGFGADWSRAFQLIWNLNPLVILLHWLLTLKRCYRIGWFRTVFTTLAMAAATIISHFIYRLIQFLAGFMIS